MPSKESGNRRTRGATPSSCGRATSPVPSGGGSSSRWRGSAIARSRSVRCRKVAPRRSATPCSVTTRSAFARARCDAAEQAVDDARGAPGPGGGGKGDDRPPVRCVDRGSSECALTTDRADVRPGRRLAVDLPREVDSDDRVDGVQGLQPRKHGWVVRVAQRPDLESRVAVGPRAEAQRVGQSAGDRGTGVDLIAQVGDGATLDQVDERVADQPSVHTVALARAAERGRRGVGPRRRTAASRRPG